MNILSLCTGYGGLDLAVEAVIPGAVTRWVSDIDKDACAVQAVRFPHAVQLGDLKAIDWSALAGQVDVMTAGYPCQPFSTAGRRKGADDPRHIWPWILRGVRLVRPRLVVLENVSGHLALGFDTVLGDLAEVGCDARWMVVRASDVGAPHRRERLFVVAADADGEPAGRHARTAPGSQEPDARRGDPHVDHRPADGVRGVAADADGTGPQRAEPAGRRDVPPRGAAADADGTAGDATRCASRPVQEPGTVKRSGRCGGVVDPTDWGQFGAAVRRWEHLTGREAPAPLVAGTKQLNARFVEWMMGLPSGWVTDVVPNRRALKTLGNGVVPQQAELALRRLLS